MSKEADRLIAEFLGETDHLKKWCSDAGGGEPLQLCIEDPGETQRPDSCRHLAKGGCWNDCKSKATTDPPAYSTLDSAAWEAIKALVEKGFLIHIHILSTGVSLELVRKHERFRAELCESLAAALEQAMKGANEEAK